MKMAYIDPGFMCRHDVVRKPAQFSVHRGATDYHEPLIPLSDFEHFILQSLIIV